MSRPVGLSTRTLSHGVALACLAGLLSAGFAPLSADAKGRRISSSKSHSTSSHAESSNPSSSGTTVHIAPRVRTSSSEPSAADGGGSEKALAYAAASAALAANAAARSKEDTARLEADYAVKKAAYDKEKAEKSAKAADPAAAAAAAKAMEGKENLKAAFGAVQGIPAGGQGQIFKVVDSKGKILFTDAPPNAPNQQVFQGGGRKGLAAEMADSGFRNLPPALAQVASRFPVVLFTGSSCAPCDQARSLLNSRGIPYQERTVRSNADIEALQRLGGPDAALPMTTVGGQTLRGFSDIELNTTLEAAGYPATSALPASYRNPAPTPLVAVDRNALAATSAPSGGPAAGSAAADGITFNNPRGGATAQSPEERNQRAAQAAAERQAAAAQAANPAGIRF